ncbi:uncharacterized protein LOC129616828 [Condylostylus longicornis]|uniref:uncharacterized protein LOC129616828 n=1 Tax=Condylostylus longicornis TaxID=2530218 RepID=UPI00244E2D64|nr:uncharacterized protein LOC129616828 [Condylostylus longicornis]
MHKIAVGVSLKRFVTGNHRMTDCETCKRRITGGNGIRCAGVCNRIYHTTAKCAGLDEYQIGIIESNNKIRFMCDECILYIQNVDMVLQKMDCAVQKNNEYLKEYKCDFENALKRNENEVMGLLRTIEDICRRYMERLHEIKNEQKKEIEKMVKMTENFKVESEKLNVVLNNQTEKLNKTIVHSIKKNDELCTNISNAKINNVGHSVSFADILKNNKENKNSVPIMKKHLPLIVKPKQKQKSEKTKKDLNTKVNPKDLKIKNVESKMNGIILIETDSKENREKIKTELQKKMQVDYNIIPKEIKPKIEIVHMNNGFSESELIEKLKKQNEVLERAEMKIINLRTVKKFNREMKNAIIEVDKESFPKILNIQKLCIGWERCKVFDAISVKRCFKCNGFNHKSTECRNEETCLKCTKNHKTSECTEKPVDICVNCKRANEKFKLGLDIKHNSLSKQCEVYKKKLNELKQKIGY